MHRRIPTPAARWVLTFLAGWSAAEAVFIAGVGLATGTSVHRLWIPYLLLLVSGIVGGPLIYWARRAESTTPKAGACRFAFAIFLFLNCYMGALLLGAISLGLLSTAIARYSYAPYILPGSGLGSIAVYVMARQKLESTTPPGSS